VLRILDFGPSAGGPRPDAWSGDVDTFRPRAARSTGRDGRIRAADRTARSAARVCRRGIPSDLRRSGRVRVPSPSAGHLPEGASSPAAKGGRLQLAVFLFFAVIAAALVIAVLIGGDVRRLGQIRIRHIELLLGAFAVKVAVALLGTAHTQMA